MEIGLTLNSSPVPQTNLVYWLEPDASHVAEAVGTILLDGNMEFKEPNPTLADGTMQSKETDPTFADGDMEADGYANWTNIGTPNSAVTLSKETSDPHSGTKCFRVDKTCASWGYAKQANVFTLGHTYRIIGWARNVSGSTAPCVADESGTKFWTGTTSTSWQGFDVTVNPVNVHFILGSDGGIACTWEYDDITISDVTTSSWTATNCIASKRTDSSHSGTQCLRIQYDGSNADGYVLQSILTAGHIYHIDGWARGDGTSVPLVGDSSTRWTGTSSSSWQQISTTLVGGTYLKLESSTLEAGTYVEFDDITISDVTASKWTVSTVIVSKEITDPHSGTQCLRLAYDGANAGGTAYQVMLTATAFYHIDGYARSCGTGAYPYVTDGSATLWTGTTSTDWQHFDVQFCSAGTAVGLYVAGLAAGRYVEYDDVTITKLSIGDGDMEADGYDCWTVLNAATLSKTENPRTGSSGSQSLRVTRGSTDYPACWQNNILTTGKLYHITGWARASNVSGGNIPYISETSNIWIGSATTDWQSFDVTWVAGSAGITFAYQCATANQYTDWDDIVLERVYIQDGNMEVSDTTKWSAGNNATLTKSTDSPYAGTYALRVAYNGTSNAYAYQPYLSANYWYRVRGYARGDGGVGIPKVTVANGTSPWTGTNSTSWQPFDVIDNSGASGANVILTNTASDTGWAEFDNVTVEKVPVISTLLDRTSNHYHPTQTNILKLPAYLAGGGPGGLDELRFEGINEHLSLTFTQEQPLHVFLLAAATLDASAYTYLIDGGAADHCALYRNPNSRTITPYAGANGPTMAPADDNYHVYEALFNSSSSKSSLDGGTQDTGNVGTTHAAGLIIGANGDGTNYHCKMKLLALIAYSAEQTGANRTNIINYLKAKINT